MELRPYQRQAVDAIYKYFEENKEGNGLIVAPTAAGKSILIAKFCEEVVKLWPNTKILILAHRKELLQQNASKIIQLWPNASIGVYSAGLNTKQIGRSITVAGIQSVFRKGKDLGWVDLILCDECHLIPNEGEGTYRTLITTLKEINPKLRIIGFTATPFRTKTGMLIGSQTLFTDVIYNIEISDLIKLGYLCPLISKSSIVQADLSNVRIRGGEFIQGEAAMAFDKDELTKSAIEEVERYASDRKSWLFFASGVEHAENIANALNERGHETGCITGNTEQIIRESLLSRFKSGSLKCIVNCDVLTVGFDAPNIDLIVLLRATQSPGLLIQMLGRGMRLHASKKDCLVLDFGNNFERHGAIDEIKIKPHKDGEVETTKIKVCQNCRFVVKQTAASCPECLFVFPIIERVIKHEVFASTASPLALNKPITSTPPEKFEVENVSYSKHEGRDGKPPSLKVIYEVKSGSGNMQRRKVTEWVSIENRKARHLGVKWWLEHLPPDSDINNIPFLVEDALKQVSELRKPKIIWVQKQDRWDRVVSREFYKKEEESIISSKQLEIDKFREMVGI